VPNVSAASLWQKTTSGPSDSSFAGSGARFGQARGHDHRPFRIGFELSGRREGERREHARFAVHRGHRDYAKHHRPERGEPAPAQKTFGQGHQLWQDVAVESAEVPDLGFGPIHGFKINAVILNLGEYSGFAATVDGVIGFDVLSRAKTFAIDYERKTISIQMPDTATEKLVASNCFLIPFDIQGMSLYLVVDTGIPEIILYRNQALRLFQEIQTEGEPKRVAMGRLRGTQVKIPGIQIFGPEAANAVLINSPSEDPWPAMDGYIGPAALHAKRVEFDLGGHIFRWKP
jgi:hypothetical protein